MCPQVQTDGQASIRNLVSRHLFPFLSSPSYPPNSHFPRVPASPYLSPVSLSCSVPYRALSTVISTERRRLSFQPSFHSTLQQPTCPPSPLLPAHPPDASFFLRIPYVRGKEFDSVVPAWKTPSAGCVEKQEFLSQRAFRRRCLRDDVELGTLLIDTPR